MLEHEVVPTRRVQPSLFRRVALCVILPLAVLLAAAWQWQLAGRMERAQFISSRLSDEGVDVAQTSADYSHLAYPYPWQTAQRKRANFALYGDTTRPTRAQQQRALWEAHPSSKVLYANYMLELYVETERTSDLATFRTEMQQAATIDPHNALYPYLLANLLVTRAVTGEPPTFDDKTAMRHVQYHYRITDRAALEEGMQAYLQGCRLSGYSSYRTAYGEYLLAALPTPRHPEDHLVRIGILASIHFPELVAMRNLAHVSGFYAQTLMREG